VLAGFNVDVVVVGGNAILAGNAIKTNVSRGAKVV
jgi:hypothetical protein